MKVTFDESKNTLELIAESQEDRNVILAFDESEITYLGIHMRELLPKYSITFIAIEKPPP